MEKKFDDLFNDFMNEMDKNFIDGVKTLRDEIFNLLNNLSESNSKVEPITPMMENEMDGVLGEPDEVSYNEDNGIYFKKMIWHTPDGDIGKVIVSDIPFEDKPKEPEEPKSLEEQLQEAIAEENYEKAAKLRDEIKNSKKR